MQKFKFLLDDVDLQHVFSHLEGNWGQLDAKRIFITGGTGFIGKWLLETLLYVKTQRALNCEIIVLTRNSAKFIEAFPHLGMSPDMIFWDGDIRCFEYPPGDFDIVIHAATDVALPGTDLDTFDVATLGTRHVLDFAVKKGVSRFLFLSSGAVYGSLPLELDSFSENWVNVDPIEMRSEYSIGKYNSEWLVHYFAQKYSLSVVTARCFSFVGPYMSVNTFAVMNFIFAGIRQEDLVINGDGLAVRTYLYAADMAVWLWTLLFCGVSGCSYNVGGQLPISIGDLAQVIHRTLDLNGRIIYKNLAHNQGVGPHRYIPNVLKIYQELGVEISINLDSAILRTAAWYRNSQIGIAI